MAISYEQGLAQLFQAPLERFVAERKRISAELKAAGDKAGAARLLHLGRPPVSAWVVNQLWWQAQAALEELFATAARQRAGDRAAVGEHRQQLSALRARAAELLRAAGHAATETTLRRVTMTLAALAAAGHFGPDSPGALSNDRDPPGFEAALGEALEPTSADSNESSEATDEVRKAEREQAKLAEAKGREQAEKREQAKRREEAQERERLRVEAERAQRRAERERLEAALASARTELDARERAVAEQREALAAAERALQRARAGAEAAEGRLKGFGEAD